MTDVTENNLPVVNENINTINELDNNNKETVNSLKNKIDLKDGHSVIAFGVKAQKDVTQVSEEMLNGVRNKDTGEAGEALNEMMLQVRGVSTDEIKNNKQPGFFGKLFGKLTPVAKFVQQYETVEKQIENISNRLDQNRLEMIRDITMLDKLYEQTLNYFHNLELYIIAGEQKLEEIDNKILPDLKNKAETTSDMIKTQEANDMAKLRDDLERKVHDLKMTRQVTMQNLPSIRMTQELDKTLVNKIQSTVINTIPMWKTQLAQSVAIARTQETASTVKEANDLNDNLLRANAENLQQANREVRNINEQSVFSIEAIEEANQKLLDTVQESIDIVNEGKQKRTDAEQRLQECEKQLNQKLLEASS